MATMQIRGSHSSKAVFSDDKENVCPLQGSVASQAREALRLSRSPLPIGFPRAPLQDITAVLSPLNVLRDDDEQPGSGFGCRPRRKRSKCESHCSGSMASCSKKGSVSSSLFRGIRLQISAEEQLKTTVVEEKITVHDESEEKTNVDDVKDSTVSFSETSKDITVISCSQQEGITEAHDLTLCASLTKGRCDETNTEKSKIENEKICGESSKTPKGSSSQSSVTSPNSVISERRRRRPVVEQKPAAPSTRPNLRSATTKTTARNSVLKFR